ncbi:MAG: tandem-95 repeat protein [Wenzhouxiangellaceae bacterium]|nr:tandem-95 repeat protein [Wenzhouxiangellaceae bacterium]
MSSRFMFRIAAALAALLSVPGLAQAASYEVLIDTDRNVASGCTVTPPGAPALDGFEWRLIASVDLVTAEVTALTQSSCTGEVFDPPAPVAGFDVPYLPSLNGGFDNADAIELAVARSSLGSVNSGSLRLVFIGTNGAAADVLATEDGTAGGSPIEFVLPMLPVQIPTLSLAGIGLMALVLFGLAILAHRRLGRAGSMLAVMLVATAAWAMNFALDGDLGDWSGIAPVAVDADGDATNGSPAIDIRAGFAALEGDTLFFRLDIADLENQLPIAIDDAYATDEDTLLSVAAPGVLDNDTDPESHALTAALAVAPANALSFTLNPDGSFDYTPAADFNGSDSFTYLANDGQANSAPATVTITVEPVDDPPLAIAGLASTDEDTPVTITLTGSDADGDSLSFAIGTPPANGSLGAITPIDATTAEVVYTPDPDFNGGDSFSFAVDDGTTASAAAAISITVNAVNDPPVADAQLVNAVEDTPVTIMLTGSDIDGDSLSFAIATTPTNGSLGAITPIDATSAEVVYTPTTGFVGSDSFSFTVNDGTLDSTAATVDIDVASSNAIPVADPQSTSTNEETALIVTLTGSDADGDPLTFAISTAPNSGSLSALTPIGPTSAQVTYTPGLDFNGADSFEFTADDGSDTSPAATVAITVDPVNDPPSFTPGVDVDVLEDSGAYNQPWATVISAGPADESGQSLTFNITANDNPGLFAVGPTLDASTGNLSFTPVADAFGSANLTLVLSDDGGTANGGVDTSAIVNLVITVAAVNDAPSFSAGADQTVAEDAGAQTVAAWATAISPGPANEAGQSLNFNVTGNTNPGLFSAGPSVGPTGTLSFTPAANAFGSATIRLALSDDGGTANGGINASALQEFTITVNPVNDPPSVVNQTLATHSAIRITLGASDSQLLKNGASDIDDPLSALSVSPLPATSTNGAILTLIDAATGTYRYDPPGGFVGADSFSFQVCDSATTVAPVQCASGTVTVTVTGPALWVVNPAAAPGGDGSLNRPFQTLSGLPGGRSTGGRIFLASGTNVSGHNFFVDERLIGQGATGDTFDGFLGVQVPANGTLDARPALGGTRPLVQGQVTLANGVTAQGFNIEPAAGTQGLFGNGAFSGISVSQMNVATDNASAVNLNGLTGSFALDRVDANGGVNGIVLTNVNGSGGTFSVLGDGSQTRNGSGGTIENSTGAGVLLDNAANLFLNQMLIQNNTASGVQGSSVTDFSLTDSRVINNASAPGGTQAGLRFSGLFGNVAIDNSEIAGSFEDNIRIDAAAGALASLAINDSDIGPNAALTGGSGLSLLGNGTATMNVDVTGSRFLQNRAAGIQTTFSDSSALTIDVVGSSFNANNTAIDFGIELNGDTTFTIENNLTIVNSTANAINIISGTGTTNNGLMRGRIAGNVIGNGTPDSGSVNAFGIAVDLRGDVDAVLSIDGNTVRNTDIEGIFVQSRLDNDGDGEIGRADVTLTNNTVAAPDDNSAFPFGSVYGMRIESRNTSNLCLDIAGNDASGTGVFEDFRVRQLDTSTFRAERLLAGVQNAAVMEAHVVAQNVGGSTASATAVAGFTGVANGVCRTP